MSLLEGVLIWLAAAAGLLTFGFGVVLVIASCVVSGRHSRREEKEDQDAIR